MQLKCYALNEFAPKIIAAQRERQWMDEFEDHQPYRCLPLTIANAHGWEVLCPSPIEVEWNGGPDVEDLIVRALRPLPGDRPVEQFCLSNFSHGIVTFHLDYVFKTDEDWDLLATGPFNRPKDNAHPLSGIIETNWLPYPFSMNWKLVRPGHVVFQENEPICFIFPVKKQALGDCQPEIWELSDDQELLDGFEQFWSAREVFKSRLAAEDEAAQRSGWDGHYFAGRYPNHKEVPGHVSRLRLAEPVDRRSMK